MSTLLDERTAVMKRVVTALAAVLLTSAVIHAQTAAPKAAPVPKELEALQGKWFIHSANGNDVTGGPEVILAISADAYEQIVNGQVTERGTLKVDAAKKPMTIDLF